MSQPVTPARLLDLMNGSTPFALIDVREPGEYNASHIPGSSLIPRRMLEFDLDAAVPHPGSLVVLCDDDGRRVARAVETVENMGYSHVAWLEGGINRWMSLDHPTEWGVNVPSKDFGEKMEVVHHVPEIDAIELRSRMDRGDKMVILDTRTPEEYRRFCIPGGRSLPGGELALRITDVTADLDPDTTVVINCAGRTRSIIGTRILQRMGLDRDIVGLKNGTSGWVLAGYDLESGADRDQLPDVTESGRAAAEAYAERCAIEDGVRLIDVAALDELVTRSQRESVYFIDVRTAEEYDRGRIKGFRWFPGGQCVQRSDDVAVVKNAPIVFCCDGKARATLTASWYRQLGYEEVYALDGGTGAWEAAGRPLESGLSVGASFDGSISGLGESPLLADARDAVPLIGAGSLNDDASAIVLFVDTSRDFARGHVPGARWVPRGWLEWQVGEHVPSTDSQVVVTCGDGRQSLLAAATLKEMGYSNVAALEGGMLSWRARGLPIEEGLSGVMRTPADIVFSGPDRTYADMQHYLRWETELGAKYETQS
ncbi:MAG: rhodanese-like domain-containing protein [Chloroflexi bacterium]|nr:rhodanese-like domain-containing protein [Chloroflexota bacterium]